MTPFALLALAVTLPFGFEHEQVVEGPFAGQTVGFAFLPDGRPLILERQGTVRLAPVGRRRSTAIAEIPGVRSESLERGLLGVAIDPGWPARPYVYFHYTHVDSVTHLTMYTASGDLDDPASDELLLSEPYLLLGDIPDSVGIHNGGTVRFGPDGMLYVSLGDDARACHAQDLTSYHGKILRLDVSSVPRPGPGPPPKALLTPPDNPFPGPDEIERLVFAWGLRNPFRFTIDPKTGEVFLGSVGFNDYEEINLVPAGGGPNFGWPQYEGPVRITQFGDCGIENELTGPIHAIPHGAYPISVTGGPRVRRSPGLRRGFPASYEGSYFYFEFVTGALSRLREMDGAWDFADPVPGQPDATTWATGLSWTSDAQIGPGGALYFTIFQAGSLAMGLHRIQRSFVAAPYDADRPVLAFPNPTRGGATVRADALPPGPATLRVVTAGGRLVRRLSGPSHRLVWDGADEAGRPVPAGTYFLRLETPDGPHGEGKLTLLR